MLLIVGISESRRSSVVPHRGTYSDLSQVSSAWITTLVQPESRRSLAPPFIEARSR